MDFFVLTKRIILKGKLQEHYKKINVVTPNVEGSPHASYSVVYHPGCTNSSLSLWMTSIEDVLANTAVRMEFVAASSKELEPRWCSLVGRRSKSEDQGSHTYMGCRTCLFFVLLHDAKECKCFTLNQRTKEKRMLVLFLWEHCYEYCYGSVEHMQLGHEPVRVQCN